MKSKFIPFILFSILLSSCGGNNGPIHVYVSDYPEDEENVFYSCTKCDNKFLKFEDEYFMVGSDHIEPKKIMKDAKIENVSSVIANYMKLEDDPSTENNELAEYLYDHDYFKSGRANDVYVHFNLKDGAKGPYTLRVFRDAELKELVETFEPESKTSSSCYFNISYLPPVDYYYVMTDSNNNSTVIDELHYESSTRLINTNGTIANMRDLGGYQTLDGKHIKYGKIYRSATWEYFNSETEDIFKNKLGITTELDVRVDGEMEHMNTSIRYERHGVWADYARFWTQSTTADGIRGFFEYVLNSSRSTPLVIHCSAGADRTGFMSGLIEAILGVDLDTILKEYELTSFCSGNTRYRADIIKDGRTFSFDPNGYFSPIYYDQDAGFLRAFTKMLDGFKGDTLQEKMNSYLLSEANLTQNQINDFKNLMLE